MHAAKVLTTLAPFVGGRTLQDLTVFAGARGWPDDEFALVTSFPKRTLNDLDPTATLAAMSLSAREQIHVSPRHD